MNKFLNSGLAVIFMFVISSCGESTSNDGQACTLEVAAGVRVTVTDGDGNVITDTDTDGDENSDVTVTVTLTEGDYTETLEYLGDGLYTGADEREGTYTLTVEADGFVTHTEEVTVDDGGCHVITEEITVELERDE